MTPVMVAAGLGSTDADSRGTFTTADVQQRAIASLTLLLKAGADINGKDSRGLTACTRPPGGAGTTSSDTWWRTAPTSQPPTTAA